MVWTDISAKSRELTSFSAKTGERNMGDVRVKICIDVSARMCPTSVFPKDSKLLLTNKFNWLYKFPPSRGCTTQFRAVP